MTSELREPDAATLEAIYNLNKHAEKYARLAEENYQKRKKATARANSLKKKALYGVKSRAINRILLDGGDALEANRIATEAVADVDGPLADFDVFQVTVEATTDALIRALEE